MGPVALRALRWFVGLSLIGGGFVLLWGGIAFGTIAGAPTWVPLLAGVVALVLAIGTVAADRSRWRTSGPAAAWILAVLLGILWARFDPDGHAFLSGFTAIVAVATGIGILQRRAWSWPVGLASSTGFGPIVLLIAPLPSSVVASGFVLFIALTLALLALAESYREA